MKKFYFTQEFYLLFVRYAVIMMAYYDGRRERLGEAIGVLSGKGGTGKTSVCAGLALALAAQGRRVLCIDCDVGLRNLDLSLGMSDIGALSFLDVAMDRSPLSDATAHPAFPSLFFLTAPMNTPMDAIDPDTFSGLVFRARREFDYVFLDAPAGVDAGFRLVAGCADRFLLGTGPGPAAIRDARRVSELLELAGKDNVRLIVNRVDKAMLSRLKLTIDDVMDTAGLPLLGVVPEDSSVTLAAAFGMCLRKYAPRCAAAKAFQRISHRLQGMYESIHIR